MYESSNFKCLQFLLCLHFAVVNSEYVSIVLKPKQVVCLEAAYLGRDLLAVLPTGYGKSIIFHLLPALLVEKKRRSGIRENDPVILVIFPLNSLIQDQLQRINAVRTRAAVLSVKRNYDNELLNLDLANVDELRLKNADYEYVLTHPESCLSTKQGVALFQSNAYKCSVAAVVVDEAHCTLEWYVLQHPSTSVSTPLAQSKLLKINFDSHTFCDHFLKRIIVYINDYVIITVILT